MKAKQTKQTDRQTHFFQFSVCKLSLLKSFSSESGVFQQCCYIKEVGLVSTNLV